MLNSLFFFLLVLSTAAAKLPSSWKKCSKSAPDHNDCIKNQIQYALKSLAKGVPELNIAPLEPFHVESIPLTFSQGFSITYFDGTSAGFFNRSTVTGVQSDPWRSLNITMTFDQLHYKFKYSVIGKLFNIKINSSGKGEMDSRNGDRRLNMTFTEYQKDGKTYLKVKDLAIYEFPTSFVVDYRPNGSTKAYRNFMNKIINDNWRELVEEQSRAGYKTVVPLYANLINSILAKIPKEDIDEP